MLLADDLLLLAYDDETGQRTWSNDLDYALVGALLIDLADRGHVDVEGEGRKARLKVVRSDPTGHPVLDEWQEKLAKYDGKRPKDVVGKLYVKLRPQLLAHLAEQGILSEEKRKALGIFPTTRWPAADSSHEDELRRQLQNALVGGVDPEPRTAALIALLHAIKSVDKVVSKPDRKVARERAKEIADGNWASDATKKAVEEMTAAVLVAVIVPAAVAGGAAG